MTPSLTTAPVRTSSVTTDADLIERHDCPGCAAPAGSPCRTRNGATTARYHAARFGLVPSLRDELSVPVPTDRGPGKPWSRGEAPVAPRVEVAAPTVIRIGYARTSTARQELGSQLEALAAAGCHRVFDEQISTRVKVRPALEDALSLARSIKEAAPDQVVILTVHEMKRLARNAAELMSLSAALQGAGIRLELLSGPLTGVYDPEGMGAMLFAVLAVAAQIERDYIREKTIEGQVFAAAEGRHAGRPKVFDDDMVLLARALRDQGVPVPEIARRVKITKGKRVGQSPSLASVYRVLAG
jgi:DNA invertase Pin-like site-specific DNA recombinase